MNFKLCKRDGSREDHGANTWTTVWEFFIPLVSPSTFLLLITGLITSMKTFGMIEAVTQGGPGGSTTILSLFIYHSNISLHFVSVYTDVVQVKDWMHAWQTVLRNLNVLWYIGVWFDYHSGGFGSL